MAQQSYSRRGRKITFFPTLAEKSEDGEAARKNNFRRANTSIFLTNRRLCAKVPGMWPSSLNIRRASLTMETMACFSRHSEWLSLS